MDHANRTDGSSNAVVIHKQFNADIPGADFIVQSSDGVIFYLHRKNLELYTDGAFPGLHDSANRSAAAERMIRLDEPSSIFEIVFQFVYPRRQPSIKGLGFQTILAVADAVEKYKVFAAMNVCEEAFIDYLQDQSLPIFLHALRYRLVNLLNQSATYLSRRALLSVLGYIPLTISIPWLRYLEAWKGMFDAQLKRLEERSQSEFQLCGGISYYSAKTPESSSICPACFCSITSLLGLLQRMDRLSDLKAALTASIEPTQLSSTYAFNFPGSVYYAGQSFSAIASRFQGGLCSGCSKEKRCCALKGIARCMLKNIEELPPFTSFLNEDLDGEAMVGVANE